MTIQATHVSGWLVLAAAWLATGVTVSAAGVSAFGTGPQAHITPQVLAAPSPEHQVPLAAGAPTFTAKTPQSGRTGIKVTIEGTHLSSVTKVLFTQERAAEFKVISDTRLTCIVPDGARPGTISLVTPAGTFRTPISFLVAYQ